MEEAEQEAGKAAVNLETKGDFKVHRCAWFMAFSCFYKFLLGIWGGSAP